MMKKTQEVQDVVLSITLLKHLLIFNLDSFPKLYNHLEIRFLDHLFSDIACFTIRLSPEFFECANGFGLLKLIFTECTRQLCQL